MIKLAIVAGSAVHKIEESLDKKEFSVEKKYETIDELWDDIFDNGSSSFVDIDKILVVQTGLLNESISPYEEQLLNLQSAMSMNNLRSDVYFILMDTETYKIVKDDMDSYVMYDGFKMLILDKLPVKVIGDVASGKYDNSGIHHPNFFRKNELSARVEAELKETVEGVLEEEEEIEEVFDDFSEAEDDKRRKGKKRPPKVVKQKEVGKIDNSRRLGFGGFSGFGKKGDEETQKPIKRRGGKIEFNNGVIAVTGDRQSGVSTTVANMARMYADNGKKVLIVDLDIKRRFQTIIFRDYEEAIKNESRVSHGLLVTLINPSNLSDVVAVVDEGIGLISVSQSVERDIKRFANKDFKEVYSGGNIVSLLGYSKSLYDVVLVDMPYDVVKEVGECLSYVDRVVMCVPNTEYHFDNLINIDIVDIGLDNDLVANTLLSKSKILLTKYNNLSTMFGKEMTPKFVEDLLYSIDDVRFKIDILGEIPYNKVYEEQFRKGKRIVSMDTGMKMKFEDFMLKL